MIAVEQSLVKTPIRNQIETLVADVPGWSPIDQLQALFQLAYSVCDLSGDILELGSWCGRSALALGLAARLTGTRRVHCVDYFPEKEDWSQNPDGTYSFRVSIDGQIYGGHQGQTVWKEPFERDIVPVYNRNPRLMDIFQQNIFRNGLEDIVVPFKGNLATFARTAGSAFRCKMAFIDGEHSYESVCRDIDTVAKLLLPGAWICFDDAFSSYEGVDRAIEDRILGNPRFELGQQITRKLFVARRKP